MRIHLDIQITVAIALVLTIAMLWPINQSPPGPDGSDKSIHLVAFAALVFPFARTRRFGLTWPLIGGSFFGGLIEVIQPLFGRSADMYDWIADILGVICGIALAKLLCRVRALSS